MGDELEDNYAKANKFHEEFKNLVRSYLPKYPESDKDTDLLVMMQDKTSCYSPYVWSD